MKRPNPVTTISLTFRNFNIVGAIFGSRCERIADGQEFQAFFFRRWPGGGATLVPGTCSTNTTDRILIAFHAACDMRDGDAAGNLLKIFESAIFGAEKNCVAGRHNLGLLVAARERLWYLRQSS